LQATGFGAVVALPPMGQPGYSDMFPLRLNDFTTTVVGVNGVMEAYRIALERSQLHGPTNFSPTINFYAERTRQFPRDGSRYQVSGK
jgi:hypothetical protein